MLGDGLLARSTLSQLGCTVPPSHSVVVAVGMAAGLPAAAASSGPGSSLCWGQTWSRRVSDPDPIHFFQVRVPGSWLRHSSDLNPIFFYMDDQDPGLLKDRK